MSDKKISAASEPAPEPARGETFHGTRLVRRAPRIARALDPHGVYDARSLARRRIARRRRTLSSLLLLAVVGVAGSAVILHGREPRVPNWAPERVANLDLDVAALAPIAASQSSQAVAVARDGRLALLDAQGQAQSWSAGDFGLRTAPLIARDLALVGGEDGTLRAFDLASRRARWQSKGELALSSRPVLFMAPAPVAPPSPAPLAAATADTRAPSPPPIVATTSTPGAAPQVAEAAEASVAVGDDGGLVRAVRLRDGKLLWKVRLGAPCGSGLSAARVSGGRTLIFVPLLAGGARGGGVAALDARVGRVVWRYPSDGRIFAAHLAPPLPHAVDGQMRLFCADDAGVVSSLDAATGRSAAAASTAAGQNLGGWKMFLAPLSAPDVAGANGLWSRWIGGGSGAASGSEPLLVSVRIPVLWVSSARGPLLLLAGNDGGVRALEARGGRLAWSADVGEAPIALFQAPPRGNAQERGTNTNTNTDADVVIVTAHGIEKRDAQSGRRLARWGWGEDVGRAQAACASGSRLLVAARRLLVFDWNAAR